MKDKKKVEEMYSFIGFFNNGEFMDCKYRKGIMDALAFVLYDRCALERMKEGIEHLSSSNTKEVQE